MTLRIEDIQRRLFAINLLGLRKDFSLQQFFSRLRLILKRSGPVLLLLTVAFNGIEQFLTNRMQGELSSLEGTSYLLWIYGATSMLISLLEPTMVVILALAALQPIPLLESFRRQWSLVLRESIRATGKTLSWGLLLVLPGLIRFFQLSFVPFVVMLDPKYAAGERDAMKESTRLVNRRFIRISLLVGFFTLLLPLVMSAFDEWTVFTDHPIGAVFLSFMDMVISAMFFLFLLRQWEKSYGSNIQLATN